MAFISRTDDPVADFNRLENERERELSHLPRCSCCNEPIQQETAVCINDEYICDECLDTYYRTTLY